MKGCCKAVMGLDLPFRKFLLDTQISTTVGQLQVEDPVLRVGGGPLGDFTLSSVPHWAPSKPLTPQYSHSFPL